MFVCMRNEEEEVSLTVAVNIAPYYLHKRMDLFTKQK